ncbi:MAG: histidine kinase dimerization/phospho-acceptor domain-containing protein [Nitrospinota bacterium]
MEESFKILIVGGSPENAPFAVNRLEPHLVEYLPISYEPASFEKKSPHIVVVTSPDASTAQGVLHSLAEQTRKTGPVFLVHVMGGSRKEYEKLVAGFSGADFFYGHLTTEEFLSKVDFVSKLLKCRALNETLVEKVRVARVAGHEINNPLTSIIGNAEMLLEEELNALNRKMVDIVRKEGLRISRLVKEMMEKTTLDSSS